MVTLVSAPLIFRTWRKDPNSIGAQSQQFIEIGFPPFIPAPPDTDHFARGLLFARVEARRSVANLTWTPPNVALLSTPAPLIMPTPQGDWPNPRGPRGLRPQDFIDPTNFALLTPAPLIMPVPQSDWPNPRGPARLRFDWIQPKTQEAAAPAETVNPGFNEWAVPDGPRRGRQDWIVPSNVALLTPPPVQMPLNQHDWPLPSRAPQRAVTLLTHTDSFKLPLQQDLPAGEREQILPVRAVLARPDWQRYTLPWAQAPPINQTEWPNPRGSQPTHLRTWTDTFKLPLQQTLPLNQYDWPNPILRIVQRQDWQQSTSIALSSAVLPPFFETEWPNPVLRTVQRPDWILPQPYALNVVVAAPFFKTDWPNPILRTVQRQDWILPQPYVFSAPVITVNPGFNEWAVPSGPLPRLRQDWIFPLPYTLNVVVAVDPIRPIDWPNPRGPAPRQTNFTDSFKLPLQQTLPPHQTDWPNPRAALRGPQDWIQATSVALSTAVQPPFFQTDWPNPRGARPANRDWQDWFKLPLQQTLPPTQKDWPNPVLRKPPVVVDWIQGTTAAQKFVQSPFNQFDWPNPTRRKISLLPTWTDSFKLPLQQTLPPRQLDWPVPKGPRQPVITALAFIQITQPSPPIPPVYDADNTLKNEIRRLRFLDNKTGRVRFLKNEIRR